MNYIDHWLIVISTITGPVSIYAFVSLVGIPIGVISSVTGWKICVTAGIKKYKLIIKKRRKNMTSHNS